MTFSRILKAVCREYGIDRHALHHKLSVSEAEIKAWEEGRSFPDERKLKDFSSMFAIPFPTLVKSCQEGVKDSEDAEEMER